MSKRRPFPYAERARELEDIRRAASEAFARVTDRSDGSDPATIEWSALVKRFHLTTPYPPDFPEDVERLRAGDLEPLDRVIEFLEADPICFRSGYAKAYVLRRLMPLPLTGAQAKRLRRVVLSVTERRDGREFRKYCRLAVKLDCPDLRVGLQMLLVHSDADVRRRAGWMMQALPKAPS